MAKKVRQGGRKNRKHGRQAERSPAMARYRAEERWVKNRARRIRRHLKRFPDDRQARHALKH